MSSSIPGVLSSRRASLALPTVTVDDSFDLPSPIRTVVGDGSRTPKARTSLSPTARHLHSRNNSQISDWKPFGTPPQLVHAIDAQSNRDTVVTPKALSPKSVTPFTHSSTPIATV